MAKDTEPNWSLSIHQDSPSCRSIFNFLRTLTPHFTAVSTELTDAEWTAFRALAQVGAVEGIIFMSFTTVAGELREQYSLVQGDYVNTKSPVAIRTDKPIRCDLVESRLTGRGEQWAQYLKGEDTDRIKFRAFVLSLLWQSKKVKGNWTLTDRQPIKPLLTNQSHPGANFMTMNFTANDTAILRALSILNQQQSGGVFPANVLAKETNLTPQDAQHSSTMLSRAGFATGTFGGISMNNAGLQHLRLLDEQEDAEVGKLSLQWIYEQTGGDLMKFVDVSPLAEQNGITGRRKVDLYRIMERRHYIKFRTLSDEQCLVTLTEKGRSEVERTFPKPQTSNVTYHLNNSPIGAFQPGNNNTATVHQTVGASVSEITAHITAIRGHVSSFDDSTRADAAEALVHIHEEVAKDKNPSKIKTLVRGFLTLLPKAPEYATAVSKIAADLQVVCHKCGLSAEEVHKLFVHLKDAV